MRAIGMIAVALLVAGCASSPDRKAEGPGAPTQDGQRIALAVTEEGFVPSPVHVRKGEPVTLDITRKTEKTCATEIMIPELGIEKELPLDETVSVTFTPEKSGELKYGCGMGQMIGGVLIVD